MSVPSFPPRTTIGIVASPEAKVRIHKANEAIEYCDKFIVRAFRTLGLQTIDASELKQLIARTPPEERERIVKVLKQLKKVTATRDRSLQQRAKLQNQSRARVSGGQIHVRHIAHADVEVRVGDQRLVLDQDLDQPVFCLTGDEISTG